MRYDARMRRLALVLGILLATRASVAHAQSSVTVTLTPQGDAFAQSIGTSSADLQTKITDQINTIYQTNNVQGFLRDFVDATEFSNRGLGVDYATLTNSLMIGIGGNLSVTSPDALSNSDHPTGGAAANFGLMLGGNLAGWGLPRVTLFGNGFYEGESTSQLTGHLTSFGGHVQIRLVEPEQDNGTSVVVRWIGLDLTTGLEYTHWTLGANDTITNSFDVGGTSSTQSVTMATNGTFNLTTNAYTVPVELTTGLRIVELVSLYGGVGMDFTSGKSTVDANLNGTLKDASGNQLGTVSITETGHNTGSPAVFHALAGVQLNLWKLKIFAQGNVSQTPQASVTLGVRLVL
jgi:hypothetical protein